MVNPKLSYVFLYLYFFVMKMIELQKNPERFCSKHDALYIVLSCLHSSMM